MLINYNHKDLDRFLKNARNVIIQFLSIKLQHSALKINFLLTCIFEVREEKQKIYLYTETSEIFKSTNLKRWYKENVSQILIHRLSTLEIGPSNASLSEIVSLGVYTYSYQPSQISYAGSWLPTPKTIVKKQAILNIRNKNNLCFLHCINAFVNPTKSNQNRLSSYPPLENLNLNLRGIQFPITLKEVEKFERKNNFSFNIFFLTNGNKIEICHRTKEYKKNHINLLLLEQDKKQHFCLIKNMGKLFSHQVGYKKHIKYHCDSCLLFFKSEKKFKRHREDCIKINKNPINFPEEDFIYFNRIETQIRRGFVIYGDCESFLEPTSDTDISGAFQKHVLFSVGFFLQSDYPDLVDSCYEFKRGPDSGEWFMKRLIHHATTINHIIQYTNHEMIANTREKLKFIIAHKCYLCNKPFTTSNYKVADHDHLNGKYRGAAHNECNLRARKDYVIPVILHNLFSYDLHLLMNYMVQFMPKNIKVLAKTCENYISIKLAVPKTKIRLLFLDSYKFLTGSLSSLGKILPSEEKQLIKKEFPNNHNLLLEKLCFPYDYVNGWSVLNEEKLPPIEKFHNNLTGATITPEEYNNTMIIWNIFKIKNIGQLSDLYLKIDVLLLVCVFETFRKQCLKIHRLDSCHFLTLPSLSWFAMLKYTKVKLEIIKDVKIYTFLEKNLKGGFACAIRKYVKSNNPFINDYDPNKSTTYTRIIYTVNFIFFFFILAYF